MIVFIPHIQNIEVGIKYSMIKRNKQYTATIKLSSNDV